MPNLEGDVLPAGSGVMLRVIFLHTLDHLLPIGCLFMITACSCTDNLSCQMDNNLCFLPVWGCVCVFVCGFFLGAAK